MSTERTREEVREWRPPGTVYLVGAGPGAPDLLTVRALRLLERADVVLHDALVPPAIVALARRAVVIDVGKRCGHHAASQGAIDRLLLALARTHATVVRLKGGDPMVFGRADEEIAALVAAGIPYRVVPGITSAVAAAAGIGVPLTRRGDVHAFALCTPRVAAQDGATDGRPVPRVAAGALYMAARCARETACVMLESGYDIDTPVAIVQDVSLASETRWFTTLGALARGNVPEVTGPAILMFGPQFTRREHGAVAAPRRFGLVPSELLADDCEPASKVARDRRRTAP